MLFKKKKNNGPYLSLSSGIEIFSPKLSDIKLAVSSLYPYELSPADEDLGEHIIYGVDAMTYIQVAIYKYGGDFFEDGDSEDSFVEIEKDQLKDMHVEFQLGTLDEHYLFTDLMDASEVEDLLEKYFSEGGEHFLLNSRIQKITI